MFGESGSRNAIKLKFVPLVSVYSKNQDNDNINIIQSSQSCVTYKQRKVSQALFSQADKSLRQGRPLEPEKGLLMSDIKTYSRNDFKVYISVYNDYMVFIKHYS